MVFLTIEKSRVVSATLDCGLFRGNGAGYAEITAVVANSIYARSVRLACPHYMLMSVCSIP